MDLTGILILLIVAVILLIILTIRSFLRGNGGGADKRIDELEKKMADSERSIKETVKDTSRAASDALVSGAKLNSDTLLLSVKGIADSNEQRMVEMRKQTEAGLELMRKQVEEGLEKVRAQLTDSLKEVREELEKSLNTVRAENKEQMDAMRGVVDEKLQKTLNERLTQSFNTIAERLEAVQKGLGEMKELSGGVNDLRRVLTNVKTRGTWGETSLETLLNDILTPDQYERNCNVTGRGSQERVDFAVKLPAEGGTLYLPIDVKFPVEDYQRLSNATTQEEYASTRKALLQAVVKQARSIRDKYVKPPKTTDFAVMYLPMEGLYAEILKEPGLVERLQQEMKIIPAGPTTVSALLNSLRMGFRSLAIQKSSREIFDLMRRVAKDFDSFLDSLDKTRVNLAKASENLDTVSQKSTKLRQSFQRVESIAPAAEEE